MGLTERELCPNSGESGNSLPWFALIIKPQHEHAAYEGLRQKGLESFLPMYRSARRWSDRVKQLSQPLFPGYVFCRFERTDKVLVLRTPGVRSVVSCGTDLLPVPEEEIDRVRRMTSSESSIVPWPYLQEGSRVRICDGPLTGLDGILVEIRSGLRVVVGMDFLQRSVAVQLSREQVQPV